MDFVEGHDKDVNSFNNRYREAVSSRGRQNNLISFFEAAAFALFS